MSCVSVTAAKERCGDQWGGFREREKSVTERRIP